MISRAPAESPAKVYVRSTQDPSQAQDDVSSFKAMRRILIFLTMSLASSGQSASPQTSDHRASNLL